MFRAWKSFSIFLAILALLLASGMGIMLITGVVEANETILREDFEASWVSDSDGDLAPQSWEVRITNSDDSGFSKYWSQYDRRRYDLPYSGDYCAGVWWSHSTQDEWLISPKLSFPDNSEITLSFWSVYYVPSMAFKSRHNYVRVSTDDGATWTTVADLAQDPQYKLGGGSRGEQSGFNFHELPINIDLSAYSGEPAVRIGWQYCGSTIKVWMVDDVSVTSTTKPYCLLAPVKEAFSGDGWGAGGLIAIVIVAVAVALGVIFRLKRKQ